MAAHQIDEWLNRKLLPILMATQKPGEWVQSLINRFDAQVWSKTHFIPVLLRKSCVDFMNCNWDRPEYLWMKFYVSVFVSVGIAIIRPFVHGILLKIQSKYCGVNRFYVACRLSSVNMLRFGVFIIIFAHILWTVVGTSAVSLRSGMGPWSSRVNGHLLLNDH